MLPPHLPPDHLDALLDRALDEDLGADAPGVPAAAARDVTTAATVPPGARATATITAKEAGTVAGGAVAARVFARTAARLGTDAVALDWAAGDGQAVAGGALVGTLHGPAHALLVGERLALNLMQRMSGIATATRRMVEAARPHGASILDTRKTAPGLRRLDKWAVQLGGGTNHRLGLHDLILIKDNHVAAAGGVAAALDAARRYRDAHPGPHGAPLRIELETRTLDEVRQALDAGGADVLLLDNMAALRADGSVDTATLAEAVALIGDQAATEASGNVTLATVAAIAATGVDAISSGALTHSVTALDLSMRFTLD